MATDTNNLNPSGKKVEHPFRKAVLRGLAVLFPPLFTIIIFAWVISMTNDYVLEPVTSMVRYVLVVATDGTLEEEEVPEALRAEANPTIGEVEYQRLEDMTHVTFIPKRVYDKVLEGETGDEPLRPRGQVFYRRYVELRWLGPQTVIPMFLAIFTILLYLLGKFMAAGIGNFFWNRFERGIHRLPLVRNVYSSVKQVSDFLFTDRQIEYTRVVAVEYPRKGIWSLGLVTGESMLDIRAAAGEPVLSVLMATSPMPVTGFTVTVRKSETIDLNITIDQAFQFIVSCGVVVPPQQLQRMQQAPPAALPQPAESDHSAEAAASGQ